MDGYTLVEVAKKAKVSSKKLLSWEASGYIEPLMRRRGRRLVRHYPEQLERVIERAAVLVRDGYRLSVAFTIARGEVSPV